MFRVEYSIIGYGEFHTEPYATRSLAEEHQRDIAGFEGVEWTKVVPVDDLDVTKHAILKSFGKNF